MTSDCFCVLGEVQRQSYPRTNNLAATVADHKQIWVDGWSELSTLACFLIRHLGFFFFGNFHVSTSTKVYNVSMTSLALQSPCKTHWINWKMHGHQAAKLLFLVPEIWVFTQKNWIVHMNDHGHLCRLYIQWNSAVCQHSMILNKNLSFRFWHHMQQWSILDYTQTIWLYQCITFKCSCIKR